jgi:hypothetical protein
LCADRETRQGSKRREEILRLVDSGRLNDRRLDGRCQSRRLDGWRLDGWRLDNGRFDNRGLHDRSLANRRLDNRGFDHRRLDYGLSGRGLRRNWRLRGGQLRLDLSWGWDISYRLADFLPRDEGRKLRRGCLLDDRVGHLLGRRRLGEFAGCRHRRGHRVRRRGRGDRDRNLRLSKLWPGLAQRRAEQKHKSFSVDHLV